MISFAPIKQGQFEYTYQLSKEIWYDNYRDMISVDQIEYMLNLMYNPERIKTEIEQGVIWEFVLYNNAIVGYLVYDLKPDNRVFLSKIYLKTTAQGLGIGKAAIERVKDFGRTNNCRAVYLTVNRNNPKGIRAYNRSGFKIIAEEDTDIGQGYIMDDYIFEFSLVD